MEIRFSGDEAHVKAPAKLNLYLEVSQPGADGYHEIDSIFQTVSLCDEIDLIATRDGEIQLVEEGIGDGESNLVYRAAKLLRDELSVSAERGVRIRLRKSIPQGAGLGGGSSDAAATLIALAKLWDLRISREELAALGARLGSDIPFFMYGGTARCRGRGEIVEPYHAVFDAREPFHFVLVSPKLHASTVEVYRALDDSRGAEFTLTASSPLDSIGPAELYERLSEGELFFNRFEVVSHGLFPQLGVVSSRMREEGFLAVLMTGSGSTFFGLCRSEVEATDIAARLHQDLATEASALVASSLPGGRFPWLGSETEARG